MNMVFEEGAEAVSQEEQEQALEAELAALEGLLGYLDTLPVNLSAASVANQEFPEEHLMDTGMIVNPLCVFPVIEDLDSDIYMREEAS